MARAARSVALAAAVLIVGVVLVLAVVVGAVVVTHVTPALGSVSSKALASSVATRVGGSTTLGVRSCRSRGHGIRVCVVDDAGDSHVVSYRVQLRGYHCWEALAISDTANVEGHMAVRARGCVKVADQIRLLSRLL